jgi:uncharacterized protein YciI
MEREWETESELGGTIIWSGRKDDNPQKGVELFISKKYTVSLLEWKPIHKRLLYVKLNSRFTKMSLIVACAPTDVADEEDKDCFYSSHQSFLDNTPRQDVLLMIGNFNARVGSNDTNREGVRGRHGIDEITDNGKRLVGICEENNLSIGGTLFQHKNIHKLTWASPDGQSQNQIDHM